MMTGTVWKRDGFSNSISRCIIYCEDDVGIKYAKKFQHPYTRHIIMRTLLICNTNNEFIQVDSVQPLNNVCINNIATTFLST